MSAIKQSLEKLNHSVENLEASLQLIQESMNGSQQDMFSGGLGNEVSKRLDDAIKNVETMLQEGS